MCCQQVADLLNKRQRKSQNIRNLNRCHLFAEKLKSYDGDLIYSLSFIEPLSKALSKTSSKASLPAFTFPHSFFFPSLHKLHSNLFTGFYLSDMVMDFDEISIDYSFIVSALALRCKEFIKFYNWNMQRILQRLNHTDGEYCTMCGPNFCAMKLSRDLKAINNE